MRAPFRATSERVRSALLKSDRRASVFVVLGNTSGPAQGRAAKAAMKAQAEHDVEARPILIT